MVHNWKGLTSKALSLTRRTTNIESCFFYRSIPNSIKCIPMAVKSIEINT